MVGKLKVVEAIQDAATVHLELDSRPESVALVRAMLAGVAERLDLDGELLDGLNTTVSEACNNVVQHAYPDGSGPLIVCLDGTTDCVEVTIRDHGIGLEGAPRPEDHVGVGLALISALADRSEFRSHPDGGSEIRIAFNRTREAGHASDWRESAATTVKMTSPSDVVGTLAPVGLLGTVLGRMARLLAARSRFSLERFADLYLLFDQLGFHAARRAHSSRVTFSLSAEPRRLEVEIGPLDRGAEGAQRADWEDPPANLRVLADELTVEPVDDALVLRVVVGGAETRRSA